MATTSYLPANHRLPSPRAKNFLWAPPSPAFRPLGSNLHISGAIGGEADIRRSCWLRSSGANDPGLFSNSGSRFKLSANILAGSRVLSAVGACPLHDGVR